MFDASNPLDDLDLGSLEPVSSGDESQSQPPNPSDFVTGGGPTIATLHRDLSRPPSAARSSNGDCLYFDLETAPDWSRAELFDLPPLPESQAETAYDDMMEPESFISSSLKECGEYLSGKFPPAQWLDEVAAAESARDKGPRDGMVKLIKDQREAKNAAENAKNARIKLLSVTPLYCRIVAIGVQAGCHTDPPEAMLCPNVEDERKAIERFWAMVEKSGPLTGFNVHNFDVPVILTRSMLLGIAPPKVLNRNRYNSRDILDLMIEIYGSQPPKGFGLKQTCRLLGITPDAEDVDGSCVNDLVEAGRWDEIAEYVRSDVRLVQRLHRERLCGVFCV